MIVHAELREQVRDHLGTDGELPPQLHRLLEAVQATYHRLEQSAAPFDVLAAPGLSLGAVFQSMRDGIIVRGTDDRISEHNPAAEHILGLTFEQMRGQVPIDPRWRLIQTDGSDFPWDRVPSRLTIRDGKSRHGILIGRIAPDRELRWLSFNSYPLHDAGGKPIAAVSAFSDITEILAEFPEFDAPSPALPVDRKTPRPTLAAIARRLDISTAAVSMALRNHPRISLPVREKVKAVAHEIGYRSDPHVRRAMSNLRLGSRAPVRANLCALGDPTSFADPFVAALIEAARQRADLLGYGFSVERLHRTNSDPAKLTRMLGHRGVDGLLLLPTNTPWDCADLVVWPRFSAVAVGHSVHTPEFDRVTVDWFSSVRGACAALAALGYRRIGAVIDGRLDELAGHKIVAALASLHLHTALEPAPVFRYRTMNGQLLASDSPVAAPAAVADEADRAASPSAWQDLRRRLRAWHRRERPDALVIDSESTALAVLHALELDAPADLGVAVLNRRADSQFAGWEERPAKVGEVAIRLLDHKIQQTERGTSSVPLIKMVRGFWRDGPSVREKCRPAADIGERTPRVASVPAPEGERGPA